MIGHISFDTKLSGKRSAGKLHATFDVAGDGNGVIPPRHCSTLPVRAWGATPGLLD